MEGKLFVISGPSGVGKNTLLNRVMEKRDRVSYSISATSRPMRAKEINGESYYFVSREEFEAMIRGDKLLEYAEYDGNYYGTPLRPILEATGRGDDIVMDVEVVGALKIKQRLPDAVLVFIKAPSFDEIRKRMLGRGDLSPQAMESRLNRAVWECENADKYDYVIVNDDLERACDELLAIMQAEKSGASDENLK